MSIKLMSKVWEVEVDHNEQLILLCLADFADDFGGNIFPSVALVGWKCGFSVRQVQRVLGQLRERCVLLVEREATRSMPRMYRLNLNVLPEKYQFGGDEKCSIELRLETIARFDQICYWCKQSGGAEKGPDGSSWHVDRIKAATKGGKYLPENVVLSCGVCNRKRGAKMAPPPMGCHPEENGVPSYGETGAIAMAHNPSLEPPDEPLPLSPPSGGNGSSIKSKCNLSEGFDEFWEEYPRKQKKDKALEAWRRKKCHAIREEIMIALAMHKTTAKWLKKNGQFIPYPATWINGGEWKNENEAPAVLEKKGF